ncbi:hypothetical protein HanIR_Chr02g0064761 [Helianthus annuus]|nr:hypothetical protein HanIR_Chr02g0064761 [Helianthus annuus]
MYQFLVSTSVLCWLSNSFVYVSLLFPYQFPLQFQIGSCIGFCISHVPASIFSTRVSNRLSSVMKCFRSLI